MLRYTGSLLIFLLISFTGHGQNRYLPTAYRAGVDIISLGNNFLSPLYNNLEINNDFQYGKRFITIDIGTANRTLNSDDFFYRYNGNFFRLGIDHNFIHDDPDGNVIFIGARYGRAFFNDEMHVTIADTLFGDPQGYRFSNENLRARWLEANAGMKIRVWGNLFLGYTLRLKFANKIKGEIDHYAYEVPGYGKGSKSSMLGFSYHLLYRFPFKPK